MSASKSASRLDIVMFIERSVSVMTGHSILPPLLLLAVGFLAYGFFGLKRHYVGRRFNVRCPYPGNQFFKDSPRVGRSCVEIRTLTRGLHFKLTSLFEYVRRRRMTTLLTGLGLGVVCLIVILKNNPMYEDRGWHWLFLGGFTLLLGLVLLTLFRFVDGWKDLKRTLDTIALIPMVAAFDRLPRKAATLFGGYLMAANPRSAHAVIPIHVFNQLPQGVRAPEMPNVSPPGRGYDTETLNWLSLQSRHLMSILAPHWPTHSVTDAFGKEVHPDKGEDAQRADGAEPTACATLTWIRPAEDLIAIQAIVFVSQFFIQLRNLAWAMVSGALLLMLAVTLYPFQPEQLLLYGLLGLLAAVATSIVWVMYELNKNEIYSRITRSTPNRFDLNLDFALRVAQFIGPMVLIVGAQLSGGLRALFAPLLELLR